MTDSIHLHPQDNVCVAARDLQRGASIQVGNRHVTLSTAVRLGHKIALASIAQGDRVLKYGQPIGTSTQPIEPGEWVHLHNLARSEIIHDGAPSTGIPDAPHPIRDRTFLGYRRVDGRAGTRNYVAVISNVNCSASVSKVVARHFCATQLKDFPHVDGVVAFTHGEGCAMCHGGLKHQMLNRVLGGMCRHPNIGACLLIGLGCEQADLNWLIEDQQLVPLGQAAARRPPLMLSIQQEGGTARTVEAGIRNVAELLPRANDVRRESLPASELIVGTQCGGSDGNSGITANPAVGFASDLVVACGGTAILSETPEISGAEHLLTRRARTPAVAEKLVERIEWWKSYAKLFDEQLDSNPSVGNKEGGLTTIAEKSLGAVAKGGSTALEAVYDYAEQVHAKGLVIMDSPGFDPMSVTGMVAGGANIVVFTTGRGSCYGCKPTPSIKVASNTSLYRQLGDDMDIDAGEIHEGKTVADLGRQIFEEILEVASGKTTRSEAHGIGDEEFVPWTVGPTL